MESSLNARCPVDEWKKSGLPLGHRREAFQLREEVITSENSGDKKVAKIVLLRKIFCCFPTVKQVACEDREELDQQQKNERQEDSQVLMIQLEEVRKRQRLSNLDPNSVSFFPRLEPAFDKGSKLSLEPLPSLNLPGKIA